MANEETSVPGPAWYTKIFMYLKNHNRIGPEKVELPDCDFFIVSPRRALRILKPPLKSGWFYEATNDRPESINDNFFARWSRRPHPSGNCRCSFRQSSRLSTTEEEIITAEINRIRTSLCEAERTGQDIEELEQRISINLENLIPVTTERSVDDKLTEITDVELIRKDDRVEDERAAKKKIVEGLEKYINGLLDDILKDTMRLVAESEDSEPSELSRDSSKRNADPGECLKSIHTRSDSCRCRKVPADVGNVDAFSISFAFHSDDQKEDPKVGNLQSDEAYVNQAFIGTASDPDSLNFYLRGPVGCGNVTDCTLEHLDCVDSGINSVETVEFQPDQEPSLEESLMEIIDAKLGRGPLRKSWQDLSSGLKDLREDVIVEKDQQDPQDPRIESTPEQSEAKKEEKAEGTDQLEPEVKDHVEKSDDGVTVDWNRSTVDSFDSCPSKDLEEETSEPSFERLRLEFNDKSSSEKAPIKRLAGLSLLRKKLATNFGPGCKNYEDNRNGGRTQRGKHRGSSRVQPVELNDYRKRWSELEESCSSLYEQGPRDIVVLRKNRKPTIVFLHGFGSSAEVFTHQLEYFSNLGYPCIAPDMLGHGMSSAPNRARDYRFDKLLKDLDVVLHHYAFEPGQKCVLVAHNYGCSFATALACKYDSSIHQLVLISGGGPTALAPPSTESAGHCCLRTIVAPFLMCGLRREILYSARGRQHPYCGTETKEQWPSHMKYILDGMVWPEGDYVFHRRICTPTLLIHGLRDNKVSLVQECQMERTMMKAFLEAIPAAGHSPMTDCPDQLNHMIQCFIDLWKNKKW